MKDPRTVTVGLDKTHFSRLAPRSYSMHFVSSVAVEVVSVSLIEKEVVAVEASSQSSRFDLASTS